MPIVGADILMKYSTPSGAAGNSNTGNAAGSLGKYISTTQVPGGALNNVFDNISGIENANSTVDYRCVFYHKHHATLALQVAVAYLAAEVAGGANTAIGVDPAPASPIGQAASQAAVVAGELDPPTGVSFSSPTDRDTAVALGTIPAGYCRALWLRRSATNSGPVTNDGVTIRIEGDTAA